MLKLALLLVLLISTSQHNVRALGESKRFGVQIQKSCQSQQANVPSFPVRCGKASATPNNHRHACGKGLPDAALATSIRGGAAVTVGVPPLRVWIGPALVCALAYALETIYIKKASNSIDPVLGGVVLQIVAALLGTLLLVGKRATAQSTGSMMLTTTQPGGFKWAILAGLTVGAAEILSFTISGMGVQAMQSIPVIIGGCILLGTLLGRVWLKEVLTVSGWCGVLSIAAGITLVGIDPGSK
jgi:transporter family protein